MARPPALPILISGGGIAGLTAAIALARAGRSVRLFEREAKPAAAGAGIQLGPNATRRLQSLGVWPCLEAKTVVPDAIHIGDGLTGASLARTPLGEEAHARFGGPYVTLHRADLHAGLMKTAGADKRISIKTGAAIESFREESGGVRALPARGREIRGAALIGADGLWSQLRGQVAPGAQPQFSGRSAWRSLIPAKSLPEEWTRASVHLWLGPDAHLVHYPVQGGRHVNVVAVIEEARTEPGWNLPGDAGRLLDAFARWDRRLRDGLLAAAPSWRRWSLFRMPPLPLWSRGRVALMGDAAHPVLPFLAQGAALAIEDAVALASAVGYGGDDMTAALARFEAVQRPRAAKLQRESARMGRIYHFSGPAKLARNLALRASPPGRLLARFDWLYRG